MDSNSHLVSQFFFFYFVLCSPSHSLALPFLPFFLIGLWPYFTHFLHEKQLHVFSMDCSAQMIRYIRTKMNQFDGTFVTFFMKFQPIGQKPPDIRVFCLEVMEKNSWNMKTFGNYSSKPFQKYLIRRWFDSLTAKELQIKKWLQQQRVHNV